jgi:transcriptional regulator with XRE-family HTH domain
MAQALGVSRQTVGRWMSDRVEPRSIYLKEWALRTSVDYGWIVTGQTGPGRPHLAGQAGASVPSSSVAPFPQIAASSHPVLRLVA